MIWTQSRSSRRRPATLLVALVGGIACACGGGVAPESTDSPGAAIDAGDPASVGDARPKADAGRDTSTPFVVDAGVATCYDETGALTLTSTQGKAGQSVCTPAQIDSFHMACLGSTATASSCKAFTDNAANKACNACISGGPLVDGGSNPSFPVLLPANQSGTRVYANLLACGYLRLKRPECVADACNSLVCISSSCETCSFADKAALADCQATAAASDFCRESAETSACTDAYAYAAGKAEVDAFCRGADFLATYMKVATGLAPI